MIEVYKILTGKYDPTLPNILHRNINSTTRGNPLKLCTYRPKYDLCKCNFTVRVRVVIISGTERNDCVSFQILQEYDNLRNGTGSVPVFIGIL